MQKLPAELVRRISLLGPAYEVFFGLWLEKFHRHTIDSFRVKHNNLRIGLLELASYLERPKVQQEEVKDLCVEIADLMKADLALPQLIVNHQQFVPLFLNPLVGKDINPGLRLVTAELIDKLEGNYRNKLVELTANALTGQEIPAITRLTDALATEALHQGFSRSRLQQMGLEILSRAKKHRNGVPEEAFVQLLENVRNPTASRYEVCYKIFVNEPATKEALLALPPELGILEKPDAEGFLEWNSAGDARPAVFTKISIDSFDPSSAGISSLPELVERLALLQVCAMGSRLVLHDKGLILGANQKQGSPFETHLEILGPLALHKENVMARFDDVRNIYKRTDLKQQTQERLRVSLRTFRNGLAARTPQEQYLLFWIGLETLVTGGEYRTASEIRDFVAAAQALDYPRKLLRDFLENLVRCDAHLNFLLWPELADYPTQRKTPDGIDEACGHLWRIILNSGEYSRIAALLDVPGFRLLHGRLQHLAGKLGQIRNISEAIGETQRRVSLHVQRLYRIRNAIVHGGYVPADLSQLSSHLLSYFWEVLRLVLGELAGRSGIKSIEDVSEKAKFTLKHLSEHLDARKSSVLSPADLALLIDPHRKGWPI